MYDPTVQRMILAFLQIVGLVGLALAVIFAFVSFSHWQMSQEEEGHFDPDPVPAEFSRPFVVESGRAAIDVVANNPKAIRGHGFAIDWTGGDETTAGYQVGAEPVDVLQACAARMQHLQTTAAGSDANAKALFAVLQAIDALEGTSEVSATIEGLK